MITRFRKPTCELIVKSNQGCGHSDARRMPQNIDYSPMTRPSFFLKTEVRQ